MPLAVWARGGRWWTSTTRRWRSSTAAGSTPGKPHCQWQPLSAATHSSVSPRAPGHWATGTAAVALIIRLPVAGSSAHQAGAVPAVTVLGVGVVLPLPVAVALPPLPLAVPVPVALAVSALPPAACQWQWRRGGGAAGESLGLAALAVPVPVAACQLASVMRLPHHWQAASGTGTATGSGSGTVWQSTRSRAGAPARLRLRNAWCPGEPYSHWIHRGPLGTLSSGRLPAGRRCC
jgi:hypothetical protein